MCKYQSVQKNNSRDLDTSKKRYATSLDNGVNHASIACYKKTKCISDEGGTTGESGQIGNLLG